MLTPKKVVRFQLSNFIISSLASLGVLTVFLLIFMSLAKLGISLPGIPESRFFDLGFFAFSMFGFVVFLTMIPFQRVEEKLSPGFYSRILRTPWAHFGLYMLLISSIICFVIIGFHQQHQENDRYLNLLFLTLVSGIVFALLFHRFWVLRYLYHPYIVYKNIDKLVKEEGHDEVWLELIECAYKAIDNKHIQDAKNFIHFLSLVYPKTLQTEKKGVLDEDIKSLYKLSKDMPPLLLRDMRTAWPFL